MSTNTVSAEGFEVLSPRPAGTQVAPTKAKKSLLQRIFDKMAANAEKQAIARLQAIDPRMAADLRAAKDRAEAQAQI